MAKTNEKTKPPGADKAETPALTRVVRRSPTFVSLYANDVQVQTSVWDVRLLLGEISIEEDKKVANVYQTGEVRMSPQLAKRLIAIIVQQLKGYEEKLGPIPIPKD